MKLMNKKNVILLALAAVFAMGSVAYADTADVPVSITITAPTLDLTTAAPTGLNFGGVINGTIDSVVACDSSANVASTPTILGGGDASLDGTGGSGTVTVLSNIDATLTITIDSVTGDKGTDAKLEDFGGTNSIDLATTDISAYTPTSLAVTAATPETLHVGGAITISNSQTATQYGGTIVVGVNY